MKFARAKKKEYPVTREQKLFLEAYGETAKNSADAQKKIVSLMFQKILFDNFGHDPREDGHHWLGANDTDILDTY